MFSVSKFWCKIMGKHEEEHNTGTGRLRIAEHTASVWSYHLAKPEKYTSVYKNTKIQES